MLAVSFYYVSLSALLATAGAIMLVAGILGKEPAKATGGDAKLGSGSVSFAKGAVYCVLGSLAVFLGLVGLVASLLER